MYEFIEAAITSTASTPAKSSKRTLHTSDKASPEWRKSKSVRVNSRAAKSPSTQENHVGYLRQIPGGGYSHTLPIRVCAAQRGRGFEAADLPEGDGGGLKKREGGGEGKSLAYERGSVRGKRFCVIINRIVSTWQETYSG